MPEKAVCPHCKGTDFYIHEFQVSEAKTDEENPNRISVYSCHKNGIDLIECRNENCPGAKNGGLADITDIQFNSDVTFNFN